MMMADVLPVLDSGENNYTSADSPVRTNHFFSTAFLSHRFTLPHHFEFNLLSRPRIERICGREWHCIKGNRRLGSVKDGASLKNGETARLFDWGVRIWNFCCGEENRRADSGVGNQRLLIFNSHFILFVVNHDTEPRDAVPSFFCARVKSKAIRPDRLWLHILPSLLSASHIRSSLFYPGDGQRPIKWNSCFLNDFMLLEKGRAAQR